jgi:hypothetical protein
MGGLAFGSAKSQILASGVRGTASTRHIDMNRLDPAPHRRMVGCREHALAERS